MATNRPQRDDDRRLNLEQQKNRAKDLHHAVLQGDPAALDRLCRHHPKARALSADEAGHTLARLSDAQLVIAREAGLASWPKLKQHIEGIERAHRAIARKGRPPDGDLPTLHMRCGSDIRARLAEAAFAGGFLELSDPLWLGPLQQEGVDDVELRIRVVAEACGVKPGDLAARIRDPYRRLAEAVDRYGRIALWCEHDPYDQFFLARVLAEFSSRRRLPLIELIAIDRFPTVERFRGLGQLSAPALRALWEQRTPISSRQIKLGAAVWGALRDAAPAGLGAIAAAGTPELPMMAGALQRHLQELPWTGGGLGLTQRLALEALRDGPQTGAQLFRITQTQSDPMPFLGDVFFSFVLREMARVSPPPFTIDGAGARWPQQRLALTATGAALLAGQLDWLGLRPPARWVGGVRVAADAPAWRWSAELARPVEL